MKYKVVAPNEVASLLKNPDTIVLDMRDSRAYLEGHIGHAIQATQEHIVRVVEEQEAEAPVLVYCYHGISSRKLAEALAEQGLNQVYSLEGGWGAWSLQNQ